MSKTNNYFKVSVCALPDRRDQAEWPTAGYFWTPPPADDKPRTHNWIFLFDGSNAAAAREAYRQAYEVWRELGIKLLEPSMSVYAPNAGAIVVNRIGNLIESPEKILN